MSICLVSSATHQLTSHRWCEKNREFLESRGSPLEFHLHRSQYMRLLLSSDRPNVSAARGYARDILCSLFRKYPVEIQRLTACIAYLPRDRLLRSPYADLASPSIHSDLEPMFAKEYCASLGMSRQVPLRVVCDIGGGGALARIEKGKKVMKDRKSEWSQMDELPVSATQPHAHTFTNNLTYRLKFHYLRRTAITLFSHVLYRRNKRRLRIRP